MIDFQPRSPIVSDDLDDEIRWSPDLMDVKIIGLVAVCLALGGPFLIAIIAAMMRTISTVSQAQSEYKLKMEMVKRGYTAADIERICKMPLDPKATQAHTANWQPVAPAKPAKV